MLLAIDAGNTNIAIGAYRGEELAHQWRLSTRRDATADELGVTLRGLFDTAEVAIQEIDSVVISSVVPTLDRSLLGMCRQYLGTEAMMIGPGIRTGIQIRYDNPREVGADRVVNAVAAFHKYGGPTVVVDFGTTTNFDVIAGNGDYLGGAIAPGIRISMDALFERAAKLPRVELLEPRSVIAKNTVESIQSGFLYGFVGQIEGIVARMTAELGGDVTVIATGGLAQLISDHTKCIQTVDDRLTLDGLRLIHEMNLEE
ncbi:MAG: type III pantothenate kinase [Candidatus Dormibacteraeota bacterium]|nr:type III pantothenate kinase [Candidatus Dormibacteraeota bacterium]